MHPRKYNKYDIWIRGFGVVVTIGMAFFAWQQHIDLREKEYKKIFLETQVEVTKDIFNALHEADMAKDEESKRIAAEKFRMISQGKAQAFLSENMLKGLEMPGEYIAVCIQKLRPSSKINCETDSVDQVALFFARRAQVEFQKNWNIPLGANEKWYGN